MQRKTTGTWRIREVELENKCCCEKIGQNNSDLRLLRAADVLLEQKNGIVDNNKDDDKIEVPEVGFEDKGTNDGSVGSGTSFSNVFACRWNTEDK